MGRRSRRGRQSQGQGQGQGRGRQLPVAPPRPADRLETWPDGAWVVRKIAGAAATKTYRCPGCDHEIAPGVPHLVAWPQHAGLADRRHWHPACWRARDRRRPSH